MDDWETKLKWTAVCIYWVLVLVLILWHVIGSYTGYFVKPTTI